MKVLYGQKGLPVGSVDGDAVFDKEGCHLGVLLEDHIFHAETGEWIGSIAGGVIYNAFGSPQAFTADCENSIPPLPPKIAAIVPPRVRSFGVSVAGMPSKLAPEFLRQHRAANPVRDGIFQ